MPINGIETLVYGVPDVAECTRFFGDFGLVKDEAATGFRLPEGSRVELRAANDTSLPASKLEGHGVREVVWGVDTASSLEALARDLASDRELRTDDDGTVHFITDFGLAMGLRVFARRPVVSITEATNGPGRTERLNQPRRWRRRAYPKAISHVVFASPEIEAAERFMRQRLGFRLTDIQVGFGTYLRAPGTTNHHDFLLLNANAPLPDMDGKLRFHHANFAVDDLDEIMIGANHMTRRGWEPSHFGLGRHRVDSALFYYLPSPTGGESEYGADSDQVDDSWVPRRWPVPLFAYSHFVHQLPPFLQSEPEWRIEYLNEPDDEGER